MRWKILFCQMWNRAYDLGSKHLIPTTSGILYHNTTSLCQENKVHWCTVDTTIYMYLSWFYTLIILRNLSDVNNYETWSIMTYTPYYIWYTHIITNHCKLTLSKWAHLIWLLEVLVYHLIHTIPICPCGENSYNISPSYSK